MLRKTVFLATIGTAFVLAGVASSGNPAELSTSNLNTAAGRLSTLQAGVGYRASSFPLTIRLTAPDAAWAGAQWRTSAYGKPVFGWVALGRGPVNEPPHGLIEIETAYGATPSVAATIARLRIGGSHLPETHVGGTTFREPSPAKLAGYSGEQFDGNVWGIFGHTFVPFSPETHGSSPADSYHLDKGEAFRIIALNVHGKTVVLFLESVTLTADQFPAFLASADRILHTLRSPAQ